MAPKVKRQPDVGVANALAQVQQHKKFKRMMLFGLRSLSEMCAPPTIKFKENSISALEDGIVATLAEVLKADPSDEDYGSLGCKIFFGITSGLADERSDELCSRFSTDGGVETVLAVLKAAKDGATIEYALHVVANLHTLGVPMEANALGAALLASMGAKHTKATRGLLMTTLASVLQTRTDVATAVSENQGVDKILALCLQASPSDKDSAAFVETGLRAAQLAAKSGSCTPANLSDTMKLIDTYQNKKSISTKGSAAMASMMSPQQLKTCLEDLANAPEGSQERKNALKLLTAMSYIESYADAIVRGGSLGPLCDAIAKSATQTSNKDAAFVAGLRGACKMLGAISASSKRIPAVVEAGGLKCVVSALKAMQNDPAGAEACFLALAPMAAHGDFAKEIHSSGAATVVLEVMARDIGNKSPSELAARGAAVISKVSSVPGLAAQMLSSNAVDTIAKSMAKDPSNQQFQENCLVALANFAEAVDSAKSFSNADVLPGIVAAVSAHGKDPGAVNAASRCLKRLAEKPDGAEALSVASVVDCVVCMMLEQPGDMEVQNNCSSILEIVATEKDVTRVLADLDKALAAAKMKPDVAFKALASVGGLSQVVRLRRIFEEKKATESVINGINNWIAGGAFERRAAITSNGIQCISNLKTGGAGCLGATIDALLNIATHSGMKAVFEKQDLLDNTMIDILVAVKGLAAANRFEKEESLTSAVEGVLKVMKKYPDFRYIQVRCLSILNELALANGGTQAIAQTGGLKQVIAYMQRVTIYEDVQEEGFRLLHTCLKADPSTADLMRKNGALEVLKAASRTHGRSKAVKVHLAPVAAALIPDDELEKEIRDNVKKLEDASKAEDVAMCLAASKNLHQLTVSQAGSRCAARVGLGPVAGQTAAISRVVRKKKPADPEPVELMAEMSAVMKNLSDSRPGCIALLRANGVNGALDLLQDLLECGDSQTKKDGLQQSCQLLRNFMKVERIPASDIVYKRNGLPLLLRTIESCPDSPVIFGAACAAIASIRHPKLSALPEYQKFLSTVQSGLTDGDREKCLQCLECLEELSLDPDAATIDIISNQKYLASLFGVMDKYAEDKEVLEKAMRCAEALSKQTKAREAWLKSPDGGLTTSGVVTKRVLMANKLDADICAASINLMNRFCKPSDKEVLKSCGLHLEVENLMGLHPGNQKLLHAVGDLLGNLGCDEAINSLMRQVVECASNPNPDFKKLTQLCNSLAVQLTGRIEDPSRALALTNKCADTLGQLLKTKLPDSACQAAVSNVARRLVQKYRPDNESPYGARAAYGKLMPELARYVAADGGADGKRNKSLALNGITVLAGCLENPHTRAATLDVVKNMQLVSKAAQMMDVYSNDPDMVAAILDFMAQAAGTKEGAPLVTSVKIKPKSRGTPEDTIADIAAVISRHRGSPLVVLAGMGAIANVITNSSPCPVSAKFLKELEALAGGTPEGLVGLIRVQARSLDNNLTPEETSAMLKKSIARYLQAMDDSSLTEAQKIMLTDAMGELITAAADKDLMDDLKKGGVMEALRRMYEEHQNDIPALRRVTQVSKKLAEKDADVSAKILRQDGPILLGSAAKTMAADPAATGDLLNLLTAICGHEGNGQIIDKMMEFKNFQDIIKEAIENAPQEERSELQETMQKLSQLIAGDVPEVLTLEAVHAKWVGRVEAGETLILEEAANVQKNLDFVMSYTEEYGKEQLKGLDSELGKEFMFGCKCISLLNAHPENSPTLLEMKEIPILFASMKKQRDDFVTQHAVQAAVDAVAYPDAAKAFSEMNQAPLVAVDVLKRCRDNKAEQEEKEQMLLVRLQLIEKIALQRMYFNNTECMAALISLWDDYDSGKFTSALLRQTFRAMRQIVNDHFVPIILSKNVPKRLIDLVSVKELDVELLPDVLFLLGTLAVVPDIKTMIGDLKGVEATLDLLNRAYKSPKGNTSRVQTNACLALANMTVGHGPNISRFTAAKGHDLNITVLKGSMAKVLDYDVANGASILMCNTCFKRDDQKEIYGKKAAPDAVMMTIKKYDGSADTAALRCLNSMLKAIGNLALFPPNIVEFLSRGIEQTLVHFYTHSENLPDNLVESSFRTVANLVMENTEAAMTQFGVILVPLLKMLQQGNRDTVSMLSLCFETLGCLCRLPANAKAFADNKGIETVLKILNSECDEALYGNGIFVLGIQTTNASSIPILINHGVLRFLVALFEQQIAKVREDPAEPSMATELVVCALRCTRRLLRNEQASREFVSVGGMNALIGMMKKTDEHAMIHLECHRVILNLICLNPPPAPVAPTPAQQKQTADSAWDAVVMDEGVLPPSELCTRPPGPRSWETLGLDATQIRDIVIHTCEVILQESNFKQLRLCRAGTGILAYFACEKVPDTIESFYSGGVATVVEQALDAFEGDTEVTQTCCYLLNNVAFCSDEKMYIMLRKKRMRINLDYAIKAIPKSEKKIKEFCIKTGTLINEKSLDPSRFAEHQQWNFPLELTKWDQDAYPNGVQDLPLDMRDEIRHGGKLKVAQDEKSREVFHWKASNDMLMLTWRIDPKEGTFTHSVPIARVKVVAKGCQTPAFKAIQAKSGGLNMIFESCCCTLIALPAQGLPDGAELNIVCGTRRARDRFVALLSEWRDAATYGF